MRLKVENETGVLKSVLVCWGESIPEYESYKSDEPEFLKYHPYSWDKALLLRQQDAFFKLLQKYDVELIFPKVEPSCPWQMYTRDVAFVIGSILYYADSRTFKAREGEIECVLEVLQLKTDQVRALSAEIEGGDVIVTGPSAAYIGHGSRTSNEAIAMLSEEQHITKIELGDHVMHLDTRLTLMPNNIALINASTFDTTTLESLTKKYDCIAVTDEETKKLGTNVFVLNPETVVVPEQHRRIGGELAQKGLKVEYIDYTEPINLGGSFRCTTLPLVRE